MSIFYGLGQSIIRRRIETTRPMTQEVVGKVFISRHSRRFHFNLQIVKVFYLHHNLTWRKKFLISAEERVYTGKMRNRRHNTCF